MGEYEQAIAYVEEKINRIIEKKIFLSTIADVLRDVHKKYKSLSDIEFFEVVARTFLLISPDKFMNEVYTPFFKKAIDFIGYHKIDEMVLYIMQKYSFYTGEFVIYDFIGKLEYYVKGDMHPWMRVSQAHIYITNYRILAHGVYKMLAYAYRGGLMWSLIATGIIRNKERKVFEKLQKLAHLEEKPCFGYQFPLSSDVYKTKSSIKYEIEPEGTKGFEVKIMPSKKPEIENIVKAIQVYFIYKNCPACGFANKEESKFCRKCGKKFENSE